MPVKSPPPLPTVEPAWATYLKAFATIFPALVIWFFANSFLLPKLEQLWNEANLGSSNARWLIDVSRFLANSTKFVFFPVVLVMIAVELTVPAWARYRRVVIAVFTVAFHTAVLLGLTAISTSVLFAAPSLLRQR